MAPPTKTLLFDSDQQMSYAQILPSQEVLARMEVAILNFLKMLTAPTPAVSDLAVISRTSKNTRFRNGFLSEVSSIFLSHSFCTKSLSRVRDAQSFVRVWKVIELCYQIISKDKRVTQRELFYKLLCDSPDYFSSQSQVNRSIQDVVALLRCTRQSLGIIASSRGTVVGRLLIKGQNHDDVDCSQLGPTGHPITGDLHLLENLMFQSDARYIIIVEKDAIFQRLAEDRIFDQIPCIMITAKGYPDVATRFLLHRLSKIFPDLPILALVDWNPAGLAILYTYKFGSISMGLEAYRYACNVKWLGLRCKDLQLLPPDSMIMMKPRDLQIAKSLMLSNTLPESYAEELRFMVECGLRAEIEALYFHGYGFLTTYIVRKIVQGDHI
ncbi:meiotic recombination protein SPO11-2 [Nymphaea colorata]|nr:meiotic recombination protein SPO11-2 [Nymphaea colorata]